MTSIVDSRGHKFRIPKPTAANAVVLVCEDGESWRPLEPFNVPDTIKDPEMMGYMMAGEELETDDGRLFKVECIANA